MRCCFASRQRRKAETGHDGDGHVDEEHIRKQRDQPEDGGDGCQQHRTHAADRGIQYRFESILARFNLLIDLLDQHDGILDQQANQ